MSDGHDQVSHVGSFADQEQCTVETADLPGRASFLFSQGADEYHDGAQDEESDVHIAHSGKRKA